MNQRLLGRIGKAVNADGSVYEVGPPNIVEPHEIVTGEDVAVKLYTLLPSGGKVYAPGSLDHVQKRIVDTTQSERFPVGMGFAIVSPEILNIVMWGGPAPSLMNPRIHGFRETIRDMRVIEPHSFTRRDVRTAGAFCCYEGGGIVSHESKAWARYLSSCRTNDDKIAYLRDTCAG